MAAEKTRVSQRRGSVAPFDGRSDRVHPHTPVCLTDCLDNRPDRVTTIQSVSESDRALARQSVCEAPSDGEGLCINHKLDHIGSAEHTRLLNRFLARRGVRNVRDLLRRYGVAAVDQAAWEVYEAEAFDQEWWAGLSNRGAYIHSRIRAWGEVANRLERQS